jgi:DNA repair protein RecO (recombination protein O)
VSTYKTDAVILRTRNLGEFDRISILFSPVYGKVDAVARGIRKPTSKLSGNLEVFSHVYLFLSEGKNLDIINQVEICNSHYSLREDLTRLTCASYFIELIERSILPLQENIELFSLSLSVLSLLEYYDCLELVLRYMELHLLAVLGLNPVVDKCQKCGKPFDTSYVKFFISLGGSLCYKCGFRESSGYLVISTETMDFLKKLGVILPNELKYLSPSLQSYKESRWLLRNLIFYHLGKDIKSIEMLDTFMKV